jgi:hypothetical protein
MGSTQVQTAERQAQVGSTLCRYEWTKASTACSMGCEANQSCTVLCGGGRSACLLLPVVHPLIALNPKPKL